MFCLFSCSFHYISLLVLCSVLFASKQRQTNDGKVKSCFIKICDCQQKIMMIMCKGHQKTALEKLSKFLIYKSINIRFFIHDFYNSFKIICLADLLSSIFHTSSELLQYEYSFLMSKSVISTHFFSRIRCTFVAKIVVWSGKWLTAIVWQWLKSSPCLLVTLLAIFHLELCSLIATSLLLFL